MHKRDGMETVSASLSLQFIPGNHTGPIQQRRSGQDLFLVGLVPICRICAFIYNPDFIPPPTQFLRRAKHTPIYRQSYQGHKVYTLRGPKRVVQPVRESFRVLKRKPWRKMPIPDVFTNPNGRIHTLYPGLTRFNIFGNVRFISQRTWRAPMARISWPWLAIIRDNLEDFQIVPAVIRNDCIFDEVHAFSRIEPFSFGRCKFLLEIY